ncbi:MAG: hypothetical protein ACUVWJ_01320 [Spirochaetota bacterium]
MLDAKEAVKKALEYLNDMFDVSQLRDVVPEEVELSDDDRYWSVKIGFSRRQVSTAEGPMASLVGQSEIYRRESKIFTIDASSGVVRSMKNAQP